MGKFLTDASFYVLFIIGFTGLLHCLGWLWFGARDKKDKNKKEKDK